MATEFPTRPTCGKCRYFDPARSTCNIIQVGMHDTPDEGGAFSQIPDPDVPADRVACAEFVEYSTRALQ